MQKCAALWHTMVGSKWQATNRTNTDVDSTENVEHWKYHWKNSLKLHVCTNYKSLPGFESNVLRLPPFFNLLKPLGVSVRNVEVLVDIEFRLGRVRHILHVALVLIRSIHGEAFSIHTFIRWDTCYRCIIQDMLNFNQQKRFMH